MPHPSRPPGVRPPPNGDDRHGTVAVEYAVIIGTLAVAIIGAFAVLSGKLMVLIELLPL